MTLGLGLGAAGAAIFSALAQPQRVILAGILLGGIAMAYVGFAVADGRRSAIFVQSAAAAAFVALAYLGVLHRSSQLLGFGFIAHAAWDAVHHDHHGPTEVSTWYPPFCAVADLVLALPLLVGRL
jgi:hypothetical protein